MYKKSPSVAHSLFDKLASSPVGRQVYSSKTWRIAKEVGKVSSHQFESKRNQLAEILEKEVNLKEQYLKIENKLKHDLVQIEMKKIAFESQIDHKDQLLFYEAYEQARKEIIKKRTEEAAELFQSSKREKIKKELYESLARILRGEREAQNTYVPVPVKSE